MSERPVQNPILPLWRNRFPFAYWDNRIDKINRYNSEDRLEALFVALQLTDLYTHIFTARARNPDQPMFLLKEETRGWDIGDTLGKLSEDGQVFTELLADEKDGLIAYEPIKEDWNISLKDWIVADFLGCPAIQNPEEKTMELEEPADLHYGGANAILNFWRENKALLHDFKHGFRVLPFDLTALDFLVEQYQLSETEEAAQLREMLLEDAQGSNWAQSILRMATEKAADEDWYDYEVSLHIHRVNIGACVDLAELTLKQLNNLFGHGGNEYIESTMADLFSHSNQSDVVEIIEHQGEFQVTYVPPKDDQ